MPMPALSERIEWFSTSKAIATGWLWPSTICTRSCSSNGLERTRIATALMGRRSNMDIKPIRSEADYERALRRVEKLWDSPEGSARSDELDILATLIEAYERRHYPIDLPSPLAAIKFGLEQEGKDTRALIGVIGQRTRVYEVM